MNAMTKYQIHKLWALRLRMAHTSVGIVLMLWPDAFAWVHPAYWLG
jgi:hypothetical protein